MRAIVLALLPFLALFLQTTFFRTIPFRGVIPDLLLILVIFYAIFNGASKGAVYGVACGLWEDLYLGRIIGVNAISKGLTAFILGRMKGNVFQDNILVGVIGVLAGTAINSMFLFILSLMAIPGFHLDTTILTDVLLQGIYNTLIAVPLYIWYFRSSRAGVLKEGHIL